MFIYTFIDEQSCVGWVHYYHSLQEQHYGSQVDIKAAQNRNEDKYKQTFEQKGLTVSLSSPITDLAQKTVQSAQKVGKSKNARINAMAAANAGYGVYSMVAKDPITGVSVMDNAQTAVNQLADGNLQNAAQSAGVKLSISYGQQKSKTESNTQSTKPVRNPRVIYTWG